jgi:hypothetical protein
LHPNPKNYFHKEKTMLKRTLLVSCFGLLLVGQSVQAGESAQNGLLGGAAGGAILGQVLGRDTKGTLIGTAIGGALGYLVGSDIDRQRELSAQGYYPQQRVDYYPEVQAQVQVYDRPAVYARPVVYPSPVVYYRPAPVVRQTVIFDRDRYCPPPRRDSRHQEKHRWQETRYRPGSHGYSEHGRDRGNTRIIYR